MLLGVANRALGLALVLGAVLGAGVDCVGLGAGAVLGAGAGLGAGAVLGAGAGVGPVLCARALVGLVLCAGAVLGAGAGAELGALVVQLEELPGELEMMLLLNLYFPTKRLSHA
jgi:hypothetical protein